MTVKPKLAQGKMIKVALLLIALISVQLSSLQAQEHGCVKNKLVLFRDARFETSAASISAPKFSTLIQNRKLSSHAISITLPAVEGASTSLDQDRAESCERAAARCSEIRGSIKNSSWKCEPDYVLSVSNTPNDYYFSNASMNKKKFAGDQKSAIDLINPEAAWDISTGSNNSDTPVVAVIDTGIDSSHSDLATNIWFNSGEIADNNIDDDANGYIDDKYGWDFYSNDNDPSDDNGHGTHVSGTIGAAGNNGSGVAGMMWQARIMPLKFLGADGSGSTSGAIAAINYAVANGAKVLNNSWGGGGYSAALQLAVKAAVNRGVLVVAAAGNEANDNDAKASYPSSLEGVLSVAAVDKSGKIASFSNYGANSVHLAAPGVSILSTWPGGYYAWSSGTSMAAPHVSGAAALALSLHPSLSLEQLKNLLVNTSTTYKGLNGKVQSSGVLNMAALMSAVKALKEGDSNSNNDSDGDDIEPTPAAENAISIDTDSLKPGQKFNLLVTSADSGSVSLSFKVGRFNCQSGVLISNLVSGEQVELSASLLKVAAGLDSLEINMSSVEGELLASTSAKIEKKGDRSLAAKVRAAKVCKRLVQGLEN